MDKTALTRHAHRVLRDAIIPELPSPYFGKVRDNYDLPDGRRIIIASDRISAFMVWIVSGPGRTTICPSFASSPTTLPAIGA